MELCDLPEDDCHYQLRKDMIADLREKNEVPNVPTSVAWDLVYTGITPMGVSNESSQNLTNQQTNEYRRHYRGSLGQSLRHTVLRAKSALRDIKKIPPINRHQFRHLNDFLIGIYPSIEYLTNKLEMEETIINELWAAASGKKTEAPIKDDLQGFDDEVWNCTFCQSELWCMYLKCENCKAADDVISCALCAISRRCTQSHRGGDRKGWTHKWSFHRCNQSFINGPDMKCLKDEVGVIAASAFGVWWFEEARCSFQKMLDHKLDPSKEGHQVGVLAEDGKFYHHAHVTHHDDKADKTTVNYISCDWVAAKVHSKDTVLLNDLRTIKITGRGKYFEFASVVECMEHPLPAPLPDKLIYKTKKRKSNRNGERDEVEVEVEWNTCVVDSWRIFTHEECGCRNNDRA